jgi:hypothetical protein
MSPPPHPGPEQPATVTEQLATALSSHYRKPGAPRDGGIIIREAQAPGSLRRCDLVYIGLTPSRGLGIDAHEIKATRADWLRELDNPAKAAPWWECCTRFWIVAPAGVVDPAELPEGWGLMHPPRTGRRFKIVRAAAAKEPQLTMALLAELLRRADNARLAQIDDLRSRHAGELDSRVEELCTQRAIGDLTHQVRRRLQLLEAVEAAIGLELHEFAFGGLDGRPLADMTPADLAAALAGGQPLITGRRLAAATAQARDKMRAAALRFAADLEPHGEGAILDPAGPDGAGADHAAVTPLKALTP